MIVQRDSKKPNEVLSIDITSPHLLVIADFTFPGGSCAGATIDLTPFQGGPFRLYLEEDGSLSTDLYRDHYWLLAEAILPERQYDSRPTGLIDENGQTVMELVERPLDLNEVQITAFPLPEVA